jgi:hypothetical protein
MPKFEARICKDMPADCCDYGVISFETGKEVCRVWLEEDARKIADLLNAAAPATVIEKAAQICDGAATAWKETADRAYELDHNEAQGWSGKAEARAETASRLAEDIRRMSAAAEPASAAEPVRWQAKYHADTVWLDIPEHRVKEFLASGKCDVRGLYPGPIMTIDS